jgi:predicted dehydrogenase
MRPLRIVIAGLGRIGTGNVGLAGDLPLSHLAAIRAVGGFELTGFVDTDASKRAALASEFPDAPIGARFTDIPNCPCDVAVIATPPEERSGLVDDFFAVSPKLLIAEKPLATTLEAAKSIAMRARENGVTLRINFNRRFDPRFLRWGQLVPQKPRLVTVRYGKGLINYASHFVDLLMHWYGPIEQVDAGSQDSRGEDPSISFRCRFKAGFSAWFIGTDETGFDVLDMEIVGNDTQIEIRSGGAEIRHYRSKSGLHYRDYAHLDEIERDVGPVGGFTELYQAIRDWHENGSILAGCDGDAAVLNMAVLEAAKQSVVGDGQSKSVAGIL